jgi:putative phosphonate metabolism protein
MAARYAVYAAPAPGSPLWAFGRAWLGRCADTGEELAAAPLPGFDATALRAITEAPRLYGWHATLKPPFALRDGTTVAELDADLRALAVRWPAIEVPPLALRALDRFLALTPSAACPALAALAEDCVVALDEFRRPAEAAELARRRAAGLSPRQEELLKRYGYPYVLDEFRYHFTLSGPLEPATLAALEDVLAPLVAPFAAPPHLVDQLALFQQEDAGRPFTVRARYRLRGVSLPSSATKRSTASASGPSLSNGTTSGSSAP